MGEPVVNGILGKLIADANGPGLSPSSVETGSPSPKMDSIVRDKDGTPLSDSAGRLWTGNWFEDEEGRSFDEQGQELDWAARLAVRVRKLIE